MALQGQMEVKAAVRAAKDCVAEVFSDEHIESPRLEEIVLDEMTHAWKVTISFMRPSAGFMDAISPSRTFKLIEIDDRNGQVVSVTHRTLAASG